MNEIRVNWNINRTGVPVFDTALDVQLAGRNSRNYTCELIWISPAEFIDLQIRIFKECRHLPDPDADFWRLIDPNWVERLKTGIALGESFPSFVIELNKDGSLHAFQEGRHRIVAMQQLGIDKVPVWFCQNRWR